MATLDTALQLHRPRLLADPAQKLGMHDAGLASAQTSALASLPSALPSPDIVVAPAAPRPEWAEFIALRQRALAIAEAHTGALRRLTLLRRANEELQNSFLALERHLPADAKAPELIFAEERQTTDARVTLGWGSPGIEQILPVTSVGLSAIEVSFCDIAQRSDSLLHIQLTSLENQQVVDQWTVPTERLAAGWMLFTLARPLVGSPRTLVMRFDLEGSADASVSLHVGRVQPVRLFQTRNAATHAALRANALSMRLWCGEPFAVHAAQPNLILPDVSGHSAKAQRYRPLAQALLAKACLANADDVTFDFAPVSHVAYRQAVACHPPARGMTVASLPLPQGARVTDLLVEVEVGNEKSGAVEFAVVLAADAERAKVLLTGAAAPTREEAVSPWVAVSFGHKAWVEANTAHGAHRHGVAFLATRMAKPGNNNFAWARFREPSIVAALP